MEVRLKIKIFNREICVCALLATNSICAKSSAEMEKRLKIKIFNREICVCALLSTNSICAKSSAEMEKTIRNKTGRYHSLLTPKFAD